VKIISDIIRLQSDEIVNVYTHMENKCIEKDGKLAIFFSREIIFSYEKFKIIKLYSAILRENKDMDKLKLLGKKILKNIFTLQIEGAEVKNLIFQALMLNNTRD